MSTAEQIYALLVEANPIPDPEALPETIAEARPRLRVVASESPRHQIGEPEAAPPAQSRHRWMPAVAACIAVLFSAAVGWMLGAQLGGSPATLLVPRISFDEEGPAYAGPARFERGTITVTLENRSGGYAAVVWALMTEDALTLEENKAFAAEHHGDEYDLPPGYVYGVDDAYMQPDSIAETQIDLPFEGTYLVYVWDDPIVRSYPVAHFVVTADSIEVISE
jgi:hypothetical protein